MSDYENIRCETADGVATIQLARPPVNVLNIATMEELVAALEAAGADDAVRVVALRGEGKCFSAGVDVGEHMGDMAPKMIAVFHRIFRVLDTLPQPTVAVVHKSVLGGGCEVAAACDMVLASDNAKLGQPEIQVGVFPPVAAALFPRIMGLKKAFELVLTGAVIGAAEAQALGLVNRVVPADAFEEEAAAFLAGLASQSGAVLRITKKALRAGRFAGDYGALETIEFIYLDELMKTHDAHEGLGAFLEKRKPTWENR